VQCVFSPALKAHDVNVPSPVKKLCKLILGIKISGRNVDILRSLAETSTSIGRSKGSLEIEVKRIIDQDHFSEHNRHSRVKT
jgi:hypothetical protein